MKIYLHTEDIYRRYIFIHSLSMSKSIKEKKRKIEATPRRLQHAPYFLIECSRAVHGSKRSFITERWYSATLSCWRKTAVDHDLAGTLCVCPDAETRRRRWRARVTTRARVVTLGFDPDQLNGLIKTHTKEKYHKCDPLWKIISRKVRPFFLVDI